MGAGWRAKRRQAGRCEFIKVLRLLESCELKELAKAVDRALAIGPLAVKVIRLLLEDGREQPAKYFRLDGHRLGATC